MRLRALTVALVAATLGLGGTSVLRAAVFGGSLEHLAGNVGLRDTPLNPSNILGLRNGASVSEIRAFAASDDKTTLKIEGRAQRDWTSPTAASTLDQAYLAFGISGKLSAKLGRQRLGFGAGYLWNPVNDLDIRKDVYNPVKYTQGIDALALKIDGIFERASLNFQIIPPAATSGAGADISRSILASQFYMLRGIFEFGAAVSARKISDSSVASQIGFYSTVDTLGSVIGAEIALSNRPAYPTVTASGVEYPDRTGTLALLNFNRRTSEKSFLTAEYLYDDFGLDADGFRNAAALLESSYAANASALAGLLSPGYGGRNSIFATFSSEAADDFTLAASVMYGADTSSGFIYPQISWSGARDITVSAEYISMYSSGAPSEYTLSPYSSAVFMRAIYYF